MLRPLYNKRMGKSERTPAQSHAVCFVKNEVGDSFEGNLTFSESTRAVLAGALIIRIRFDYKYNKGPPKLL